MSFERAQRSSENARRFAPPDELPVPQQRQLERMQRVHIGRGLPDEERAVEAEIGDGVGAAELPVGKVTLNDLVAESSSLDRDRGYSSKFHHHFDFDARSDSAC